MNRAEKYAKDAREALSKEHWMTIKFSPETEKYSMKLDPECDFIEMYFSMLAFGLYALLRSIKDKTIREKKKIAKRLSKIMLEDVFERLEKGE